jgi:exodeoxyribonuclease-5
MNPNDFKDIFLSEFQHEPTSDQNEAILKISEFLKAREAQLFVLKGYAGTGKTTLMGALVRALAKFKFKSVLLAPTGRAAKVLSKSSEKIAFTIHKKIYFIKGNEESAQFVKANNLHKNTIFIIDEASMIPGKSDGGFDSQFNLLDDLVEYVYSGENCRAIFIGDNAQLPPVSEETSPALDISFLNKKYNVEVIGHELKQVLRQELDSGILNNATTLRNEISLDSKKFPKFDLENFNDIIRVNGHELEDTLNTSFSKFGEDETVVICRSNKRAYQYNMQIRARLLWKEEELCAGDKLMIVKNNYNWLDEKSEMGFIANGDIVAVQRVYGIEDRYGFRFADVAIKFIDYPNETVKDVKIILNTLISDSASLTYPEFKQLLYEVKLELNEIKTAKERYKALKSNEYLNALQVKFAWAVTCHKAQGGQWSSVFIDQGYLTREMINKEYHRWLYTAFTRASEKLYLVNFHEDFFPK